MGDRREVQRSVYGGVAVGDRGLQIVFGTSTRGLGGSYIAAHEPKI